MDSLPQPIVTPQIEIIDSRGVPRIVLSAKSETPHIQLLQPNGVVSIEISLDAEGRPAIKLANPNKMGPTAALEVDDKGAHVKFDRPGGATSYLFLNSLGGSGVVLFDAQGVRRLGAMVELDGTTRVERLDPDGKPVP
jgi:hypothetical protein